MVNSALIQGTNLSDRLDDLSHMGDGGVHDPGTNDMIYGYRGANIIDTVFGGGDQDFIVDQGTGNDRMYGETDSDQFVVGAGNDRIDVRRLDARPELEGEQDFTFDAAP
ncbi:MAG TPA: hypothetical protein VHM01_06685 [Alphaproteobacteria bacterium]|nr:hypothetical protein [Alphaproteobacteria bacterium]